MTQENLTGMIRVASLKAGARFSHYSGTVFRCAGCDELFIARDGAKVCSPRCDSVMRRAKKQESVSGQ